MIVGLRKRPSREGLKLLSCGIPQDSHRGLCAYRAKSLVPMEGFIRFPVTLPQHFNLLYFLVVFSHAGKEMKEPCFEQIIRHGGFREKVPSPYT
jgi:hypothetical protein